MVDTTRDIAVYYDTLASNGQLKSCTKKYLEFKNNMVSHMTFGPAGMLVGTLLRV